MKCCEEFDYINYGKNVRLWTKFSLQACNDVFSLFQKKFSESDGFALLVLLRHVDFQELLYVHRLQLQTI
jgi:hypothetical protein